MTDRNITHRHSPTKRPASPAHRHSHTHTHPHTKWPASPAHANLRCQFFPDIVARPPRAACRRVPVDLLLDHLTTPAWREEGKNGVVENYKSTIKRHFYVREKFMRICQNRPLDKFIHSSTLCIVTCGTIKIYAVQIYATST